MPESQSMVGSGRAIYFGTPAVIVTRSRFPFQSFNRRPLGRLLPGRDLKNCRATQRYARLGNTVRLRRKLRILAAREDLVGRTPRPRPTPRSACLVNRESRTWASGADQGSAPHSVARPLRRRRAVRQAIVFFCGLSGCGAAAPRRRISARHKDSRVVCVGLTLPLHNMCTMTRFTRVGMLSRTSACRTI
jgi:hypothetical protein